MRFDAVALTILLTASVAGAWYSAQRHREHLAGPSRANNDEHVAVAVDAIIDAGGYQTACRDYQRIVCGSTIVANAVTELVNARHVVMTTQWWADNSPNAFR